MLAIETSINILWFPVTVIIAALAGYIFRSNQIQQARKRIVSLENEMLSSHAEILKFQHELVTLQNVLSPYRNKMRLVSFKESMPDEKFDDPEVGAQQKANQ